MPDRPRRLPVSTRHALALALDLAVRRDPLHSLVVPLLLRAPWIIALLLLPAAPESGTPALVVLVTSVAMLGDYLAFLLVTSMLRFRARSVFNTPHDQAPAHALECYAQGLGRLPWLFVTEVMRNVVIGFGALLLIVPGLFMTYRLAFATEAVVLTERDLSSAFRHSFNVTHHRFERWLELMVASGVLVVVLTFLVAVLTVFIPGPTMTAWVGISMLLVAMVTPVIQYSWTFFYLRLVEIEEPLREPAPMYPATGLAWPPVAKLPPQLTLVEPATSLAPPESAPEE